MKFILNYLHLASFRKNLKQIELSILKILLKLMPLKSTLLNFKSIFTTTI